MVEGNLIEIGNRKTNNVKIAAENGNYAEKNMQYAHLQKYVINVAICEICGNCIFA